MGSYIRLLDRALGLKCDALFVQETNEVLNILRKLNRFNVNMLFIEDFAQGRDVGSCDSGKPVASNHGVFVSDEGLVEPIAHFDHSAKQS